MSSLAKYETPLGKVIALASYSSGRAELAIEARHKARRTSIRDPAVDFVKGLMSPQPLDRFSAETALQSPWLAGVEDRESEIATAAAAQHQALLESDENFVARTRKFVLRVSKLKGLWNSSLQRKNWCNDFGQNTNCMRKNNGSCGSRSVYKDHLEMYKIT